MELHNLVSKLVLVEQTNLASQINILTHIQWSKNYWLEIEINCFWFEMNHLKIGTGMSKVSQIALRIDIRLQFILNLRLLYNIIM